MIHKPFAYLILACCSAAGFLGREARGAIHDGGWVDVVRSDNSAQGYSNVAGEYGNGDPTYGGSLRGGEFRVIELDNSGNNTLSGPDTFKTFCLEYSEYISLGAENYIVTIDSGAIQGGLSGASPANYDPLSGATQWLYAAYRDSSLDDYVLDGTASFVYDSPSWADALQLVFWRLEGELPSGDFEDRTLDLDILDHAASLWTFYMTYQDWFDDYTNGNVAVLNLWLPTVDDPGNPLASPTSYGLLNDLVSTDGANLRASLTNYKQQSQLYLLSSPEDTVERPLTPEPASLIVWGGLSLAGLIAARRRQKVATPVRVAET